MIRQLLEIKQKLPFIWKIIESMNGVLFRLFFFKRVKKNALKSLHHYADEKYIYRLLGVQDLPALYEMLQRQNQEQFEFFKPHSFDKATLSRLYNNPSFLMFGVSDNDKFVGYFFLRCFVNKKSFIGRLVDYNYQGQGLGKKMGNILYNIGWSSGFQVFSTISINNVASFESHKANKNLEIVKELSDNYYLVRFVNYKK